MCINYTMFNVKTTRPLIPREQNYVLDRKLVTIHSDDRDIKKWPFSSHFEVELPAIMENVESMRLVAINMPINNPQFKNDYQNTKISFRINPKDTTLPYHGLLLAKFNSSEPDFQITIQDGFYCPEEVAMEIQQRMNQAVTDYLADNALFLPAPVYNRMRCLYDRVGIRFWFGNTIDEFFLDFGNRQYYTLNNCQQPNIWDQTNRWGLPSYIGFDKETYQSEPSDKPINFHYLGPNSAWITPSSPTKPVYYVQSQKAPFLTSDVSIYMECDKYNSMDELKPYVKASNADPNNGNDSSRQFDNRCGRGAKSSRCVTAQYDYNGYVNAVFAKIPLQTTPLGALQDSRNGFLQNVTAFDVPEEKISKIKVKFRYHDGRLIDFDDVPFDFTIEFNQLKNEIMRTYNVRVPNAFNL